MSELEHCCCHLYPVLFDGGVRVEVAVLLASTACCVTGSVVGVRSLGDRADHLRMQNPAVFDVCCDGRSSSPSRKRCLRAGGGSGSTARRVAAAFSRYGQIWSSRVLFLSERQLQQRIRVSLSARQGRPNSGM
ncbi:hypothetical protein MTO96_014621 [Rhipicephalus appendiculatus]